MKFFKTLLVTLVAFLLSGCYTQLQYSQTMKKITDEKKTEESKVYSWNGDEQAEAAQTRDDEVYSEYTEEDYVPIYYKDYNYERRYEECGCNPYNVYNFYGSDWYGYDSYYSHYRPWGMSPFHYHRWYHPYYRGFHHPRFAFSFSFGLGSPFYYHRFYDPFYDPFFDYYHYRYGFYRPYASAIYFYGKSGYGQGVYDPDDQKRNQNVRYGPRSIGTNRVTNDGNRSRDSVRGREDAAVTNSPNVRTRSSVGTTRSRSTTDRNTGSTVNRTRSQNSGSSDGNSRSRSRDNKQSSNIDRTRDAQPPVIIDGDRRSKTVRSRTANRSDSSIGNLRDVRSRLRTVEPPNSRVEKSDKNRRTFFNRMKGFIHNNTTRIINNNGSNRTIRSRSSSTSSRSTVRSSNSRSNRSSVTKSRSSSSNTRSRGNTSSSRSRSSDDSGGGSDRSRDQ